MKPEEDILIRAQRLLAESAALGRQCAAFYERQDQEHSSPELLSQPPACTPRERMNEGVQAPVESLQRYYALDERAHALRLAIEATQAKIAAVEALSVKWGRTGPAPEKWPGH